MPIKSAYSSPVKIMQDFRTQCSKETVQKLENCPQKLLDCNNNICVRIFTICVSGSTF